VTDFSFDSTSMVKRRMSTIYGTSSTGRQQNSDIERMSVMLSQSSRLRYRCSGIRLLVDKGFTKVTSSAQVISKLAELFDHCSYG
jgi:hypothetical protein